MRKTYRSTDVEVTFDLGICIHVGECLRGEPAVFQLERRPWILPDAGGAIAEVIHRCPSGALQYRRLDGGPEETYETTTATPIKNGPLLVVGDIDVRHEDGTVERLPRATLCRCGQSRNKPFCDNEHLRIKFEAPGAQLKIHLTPVRPREDEPIQKAADPRA